MKIYIKFEPASDYGLDTSKRFSIGETWDAEAHGFPFAVFERAKLPKCEELFKGSDDDHIVFVVNTFAMKDFNYKEVLYAGTFLATDDEMENLAKARDLAYNTILAAIRHSVDKRETQGLEINIDFDKPSNFDIPPERKLFEGAEAHGFSFVVFEMAKLPESYSMIFKTFDCDRLAFISDGCGNVLPAFPVACFYSTGDEHDDYLKAKDLACGTVVHLMYDAIKKMYYHAD